MKLKINYVTPIVSCPVCQAALIKTQYSNPEISHFRRHNVMKNSDLGQWNKFLFKAVDKISEIFENHPKMKSKIIDLSAKMVRKTGSLSKLNVIL